MSAQLQGQIQASPFDALVQDKDFMAAPAHEKTLYLQESFIPKIDPDFAKATPEDQAAYMQEVVFPKVGLSPKQTQTGNPLDVLTGMFGGAAETGSYITQPVERLFNTGVKRYEATSDPAYQNNPYFKTGADIGRIGSGLASVVGASGGALAAGVPAVAAPIVGGGALSLNENLQRFLGGQQNAGQSVFNTLVDTATAGIGGRNRNLLSAIASNAGIGGGVGALSSAGNQLLMGNNPMNNLLEAATQGAVTGGVFGAGGYLGSGGRQLTPRLPKKPQADPVLGDNGNILDNILFGQKRTGQYGLDDNRTNVLKALAQMFQDNQSKTPRFKPKNQRTKELLRKGAPIAVKPTAMERFSGFSKDIKRVKNIKGISPEAIRQEQKKQLKKMFAALQESKARDTRFANPKGLNKTYNRLEAMVQKEFQSLEPKKETVAPKKQIKGQVPKEIIKAGVKYRQKGKERLAARFNQMLESKYDKATRQIINAEIKAEQSRQIQKTKLQQEKARLEKTLRAKKAEEYQSKLKEKAANEKQIQKEKGKELLEPKKSTILKGRSMVERFIQEGKLPGEKAAKPAKMAPAKTKAQKQKQKQMRRTMPEREIRALAAQAGKSKKLLEIRYKAEVTGETSTFEYKKVLVENPAFVTKDGRLALRAINPDGYPTTYLYDDPRGSRIISARLTDEDPPFAWREENGKIVVDGVDPSARSKGALSSEIEARIKAITEVIKEVESGTARVDDIVRASDKASQVKQLKLKLEDSPPPTRKKKQNEVNQKDKCD